MTPNQLLQASAIYGQYQQQYALLSDDVKSQNVGRRLGPFVPFRILIENKLLGVYVARYSHNRYQVALSSIEPLAKLMGYAQVDTYSHYLVYLLTDAYFKTGQMEIEFLGPRRGEKPSLKIGYMLGIPEWITRYAKYVGVTLHSSWKLSAADGERLYLYASGFTSDLVSYLKINKLDPIKMAFLVNRGIWSTVQIRYMVKYSNSPVALLTGDPSICYPQNIFTRIDFARTRFALLAELTGFYVQFSDRERYRYVDAEWINENTIQLKPSIDFSIDPDMGSVFLLQKDQPGNFVIFPGNTYDYEARALDYIQTYVSGSVAIVVTKDFRGVNPKTWRSVARVCNQHNSRLIIMSSSLSEIGEEVQKRLRRSQSNRHVAGEVRDE